MSASPIPLNHRRSPAWLTRGASSHHDRWTVSYVDVLTILLVFFIAAAAQMAARAPTPAMGERAEKPPSTNPALTDALKKLKALGFEARLAPRGLVVSLPQSILFSSGEDRIGDDALPLIEPIADILTDLPNSVRLAGYADAVHIHGGRFRNNWELAAARGLRLLEVLSNEFGIDEARLSVESFGSHAPRDSNDTDAGRALNRRVEILILN